MELIHRRHRREGAVPRIPCALIFSFTFVSSLLMKVGQALVRVEGRRRPLLHGQVGGVVVDDVLDPLEEAVDELDGGLVVILLAQLDQHVAEPRRPDADPPGPEGGRLLLGERVLVRVVVQDVVEEPRGELRRRGEAAPIYAGAVCERVLHERAQVDGAQAAERSSRASARCTG